MNKTGNALRYPFAQPPAVGEPLEVAPGVLWLRLPLPYALNHINVWILRDADSATLVDTGINSPETRDAWERVFSGVLAGLPIKRIISTHYHPDHMGASGWLVQRTGAPFFATRPEWDTARKLFQSADAQVHAQIVAEYCRAGLARGRADEFMRFRARRDGEHVKLPDDVRFLDITDRIAAGGTTWRLVIGRGHSPEMAALFSDERGVLISGDQVLPVITPNVSVHAYGLDNDPLKLFLATLQDFRRLAAETLVLPSHKLPFYGLRERIDDLVAHHDGRLEIARATAAQGATAAQVMDALFPRELDTHQTFFAIGETLAHLNYLIGRGEMRREQRDGVDLYIVRAD